MTLSKSEEIYPLVLDYLVKIKIFSVLQDNDYNSFHKKLYKIASYRHGIGIAISCMAQVNIVGRILQIEELHGNGRAKELLNEINFFNNDIMCYRHDVRQCIYSESEEVKLQKLDYPDVVNSQMSKYRMEGFPHNYGLFDSGFTIRKNNEKVNEFNDIWWDEVKNFSARDQLSQVYSSWKTEVQIKPISVGNSIYINKYLNPKIKHPKKWLI